MKGQLPLLGRTPSALRVLRGANLTGKTAIVTGASSGIGVETARTLAQAGAHVIIACRNVSAGNAVAARLVDDGIKGSLAVLHLDLSDLESVSEFATTILDEEKRLDFLILNAGVMACPLSRTKQGFEMQIGTNHIGHFVLTKLLLGKMLAQGFSSRIVSVTSNGHFVFKGLDLQDLNWETRKYHAWKAYGASKLANILFIKELADKLRNTNVTAFSVHPGMICTPILRHHVDSQSLFVRAWSFVFNCGMLQTPNQGASTTIYACVAPELDNAASGAYLAKCRVQLPSKEAQDPELPALLWQATEDLLAKNEKAHRAWA